MAAQQERQEMVAQLMSATGWSCEDGQALLAANDWQLQAALAEALGADFSAHASLEHAARRSREDLDRDLATALASSTGSKEDALHEQQQLLLLQEDEVRLEQQFWQQRAQAKRDSPAKPVAATGSTAAATAAPAARPLKVPSEVRDFLEGAGLGSFLESFAANGYDEMSIIRLMGNTEMDEVGLKGGHKLKLREALRRIAEAEGCGASSSASAPGRAPSAASAGPAPMPAATAAADAAAADAGAAPRPAWLRPAALRGDEAPPPRPRAQAAPSLGAWPDEAPPPQPRAEAAPSLGPWPAEAAVPAPTEAPADREEPQRGLAAASRAAGSGGGSRALDSLLRGPGNAKPQQRRYIKDGKITYVDE